MFIIRKMRLQRGWSQSELALFSGVSVRTVQRLEKGGKPGLETLKSLADAFDVDVALFQQEADMSEEQRQRMGISPEEHKVLVQVRRIRSFYVHGIIYLIAIALMFLLNFLLNPQYIWAWWSALGWGIGLLGHGAMVFVDFRFLGPEWERRQVEKRLGRKL